MSSVTPQEFAIVLFGALAYFLPFIVALWRSHRQSAAIFVLNLLLGWTFIGWAVALVWAVTRPSSPKTQDCA